MPLALRHALRQDQLAVSTRTLSRRSAQFVSLLHQLDQRVGVQAWLALPCCNAFVIFETHCRVPKTDGDFLQRSVVQTFKQQEEKDMLWNHGSASSRFPF